MKQIKVEGQKGAAGILVILVALIALGITGFFLLKNSAQAPMVTQAVPTVTPTPTQQPIQSDADLQKASSDLGNTNIDTSVDTVLNQNTSDAQSFAPRIRAKNGTSLNWAGYAVKTNLLNPLSSVVNDVKGSWTIPTLTCTGGNTYSAQWVGIDGYSDNTVEQTGVEADCVGSSSAYYAWFEMYPRNSFMIPLTVRAGDSVQAEVKYIGGSNFKLMLSDSSSGSFTTTQKLGSARRQSAEWIMEAPWAGGILPLANFGTRSFTSVSTTFGTTTGTITNPLWQKDAVTMTNSTGATKAAPLNLSANGNSFSIQWYSSN